MSNSNKKNFNSPDETQSLFDNKIKIDKLTVGGLTVQKETIEPGWQWSKHNKSVSQTDSCQKFHVKYVISGKQKIVMDDGIEMEIGPGDFAIIQPGHDAWTVGDEPTVLLEFAGAVKQPEK